MKTIGLLVVFMLAGAIVPGLDCQAEAEHAISGIQAAKPDLTAPARPGWGGRGRGWGAQLRRAQLASSAEQTSTQSAAGASAAQAGCPACRCMQGGCMMMPSAATSQSAPMQSGAGKTPAAANGMGRGRGGMGMGRGMSRGGAGPRPDMREAMPVIHDLLAQHKTVKRTVENTPQGIRTETTSDDPKVAAQIRKHVGQMKQRLEQGLPLRMWDPLFRELFRNAGKIKMQVEEIPGGVRVTETSADPQTRLLIRQHAQAVIKFVETGMRGAMEPHALPKGYKPE